MQMPFVIRQQIEQIRAYAATAAAEAHSDQANQLVALLQRSAEDLEITARVMSYALGPDPAPLDRSAYMSGPLLLPDET